MPYLPQGRNVAQIRRLTAAAAVNAISLFLLGYALVPDAGLARLDPNRICLALTMAVAGVAVFWALLRPQPTARGNLRVVALALVAAAGLLGLLRSQILTGDRAALATMIRSQSSAILVCNRARLQDPQVIALCDGIVARREAEIAQMQSLIAALDGDAPAADHAALRTGR
ncbi:DUF305 domain-containing protein [Frigidibacter oleivorans]|uniref:DUF305 domain-containing protein n=1 Tax=Frigidibacter oleivorans TaxID=2487129 RepID=UPI000F8E3473|nr:hypothetical protein [Frigidibacter oleivorans]